MVRENGTDNQQQTAATLVKVVHELTEEIHPQQTRNRPVTLDSSLDHDLGLDSLARMELLNRIEASFGLTLAERAFADADTTRDLLRAVVGAEPQSEAIPPDRIRAVAGGEIEAVPHRARTLPEVLDWHLQRHAERPHIRFFADRGEGEVIDYRRLHQGATAVAAGLQRLGLPAGAPVAIMLPSEADYFFTFFGILLAGGVPVPIYPPARKAQLEDHLRRQIAILGNCAAGILVTIPEALLFGRLLKTQLKSLQSLITVAELSSDAESYVAPSIKATDTAFLQYTSGSTGNPKGVILSHTNLLANIRAMGETVQVDDTDVVVSWLPLYHDMGLIGCWLSCLYYATPLILLSPLDFLARPKRWLQAIHRYRGTLSPAPNFAYEICLAKLQDEDLAGLDLSSWRAAFNGAEPVSPNSIERFCERFAPYGFRREAMMPVYGMAECSVGLAFPPFGREPICDRIDREEFMRSGRAVPVGDERQDALCFVACGRPLPGHEIRILDAAGHELPERQEGRVQFRGPSACSGYFRNPEATGKLFDGDWLDSGDLGYITAGDIYLTGRSKDLIILAGRNIYPPELEEAVANLPGIRKGNVAVFGSTDQASGTERLVILAETRETDPKTLDRLRSDINRLSSNLVGAPPHDLILAPPQTIPKTSSGKIRRAAAGELYERGLLGKGESAWRQYLRLALISLAGQLRRSRRFLSTIVFAAYAWALFYLLMPPVYLAVLLLPHQPWRWSCMRAALRILRRATRTPLNIQGLEQLSSDRPCVIVANHASYLDAYALIAALPMDFSFAAKAELMAHPAIHLALRRIGTEFVERFDKQKGVEDARRIVRRAQEGRSLMFFPEGTFTRVPGLRPFHMGAFAAAAEAGLPVVPIAIRGTRSILRANFWFPQRGAISLHIGQPIEPAEVSTDESDQTTWNKALQLRDLSRRHILRFCGEPDLGREKPGP